jgi:transposase-like protein
MPRKKYTSEFKTKIVLSILQGDKEFNVICSENGLNPNMVRKWKQEFLQSKRKINQCIEKASDLCYPFFISLRL